MEPSIWKLYILFGQCPKNAWHPNAHPLFHARNVTSLSGWPFTAYLVNMETKASTAELSSPGLFAMTYQRMAGPSIIQHSSITRASIGFKSAWFITSLIPVYPDSESVTFSASAEIATTKQQFEVSFARLLHPWIWLTFSNSMFTSSSSSHSISQAQIYGLLSSNLRQIYF